MNLRTRLDDIFHSVVLWNYAAGNDKGELRKLKQGQQRLCEEEYHEFIDAWKEGTIQEVVKELCDCFVVYSFAYHLECPEYTVCPRQVMESGDRVMTDHFFTMSKPEALSVIVSNLQRIGVDYLGALEEVGRSNWSKFPLCEKIPSVEEERVATEKDYRRKKDKDTIIRCISKDKRIIFKNQDGKVVKPFSFYFDPKLEDYIPRSLQCS